MKYMRFILSIFLILQTNNIIFSSEHPIKPSLILADSVYLIQDEPYNESLPRNFRKCSGGFIREHDSSPDTTGLNGLNISGSSEFSNKNLPVLIQTINSKKLIVIDLRQESHGFINGMPVSWYGKYDWANVALSRDEVIRDEKNKLDSLKNAGNISIIRVLKKYKATDSFEKTENFSVDVSTAQTEQELTGTFNTGYLRFTISDHRKPPDKDVDRFIEYISSLNGDSWVHFHCHAGDGRTTTFMTMYDIMKNAKKVSFDDVIKRQYLIGGIDLSKDEDFPEWDKQYAIERTEFLKKFYEYSRSNNDGFKTLYTSWLNSK